MPIEVFTSYTEVDPSGRWTVGASTVTGTGIPRNEDSYVYKDFGADHFGDFEHLFRTRLTESGSTVNGICYAYALANSVDDQNNATNSIGLYWNRPNTPTNRTLNLRYDPTGDTDASVALSGDTDYYITLSRSGSTVTAEIYSDEARTTLVDTLSITAVSTALRYLFAGSSWNSGTTQAVSIEIGGLDLQEGGGDPVPTLDSIAISRNGDEYEETWSEVVTRVGDPTLTFSGGAVTATYSTGSGVSNILTYTLSRTIQSGETGTIDRAADSVTDSSAQGNAAIDDQAVTNNSEVGGAFPILDFRADSGVLDSGGFGATDTEDVDQWDDSSWQAKSLTAADAASRMYKVVENDIESVRGYVASVLNAGESILGTETDRLILTMFRQGYRPPATQTIWSEGNTAAVNPCWKLDINTSGQPVFSLTDGSAATVYSLTGTTDLCDGQPHLVTVSIASGAASLRVDQVEEDTDTEGTHDLASATFNDFAIGDLVGSGSSQHWHGDLFALVVYESGAVTVSTTEAAIIAEYEGATRPNCIGIRQYSQELFQSAIRYNGKEYFGWANELGHAGVTVLDGATRSHHVVATGLSTNWHNSLCLAFCSDGKILGFYSQHNSSSITQYKSTNAEDATAWGSGTVIENTSANHAYVQSGTTNEGVNGHRIYLFWRNENQASWEYMYSDDDGGTWTSPAEFWAPTTLTAPAKLYVTCVPFEADNEIHFALTSGWRAHTGGAVDLFHIYLDGDDGDWKATDGTVITLPATESTATMVYDSSANNNRNPDAASNIVKYAGNPCIGFGNGREGFRARWTGSAFALDAPIVDLGVGESGLTNVAPDPFDSTKVYYSTDDWVPGGTFPGDVYVAVTADDGDTWTPTALTSGQHHGYTKGVRLILNGTATNFLRWARGVDQAVTTSRFSWMTFSYPAEEVSTNGPGFLSSPFRF